MYEAHGVSECQVSRWCCWCCSTVQRSPRYRGHPALGRTLLRYREASRPRYRSLRRCAATRTSSQTYRQSLGLLGPVLVRVRPHSREREIESKCDRCEYLLDGRVVLSHDHSIATQLRGCFDGHGIDARDRERVRRADPRAALIKVKVAPVDHDVRALLEGSNEGLLAVLLGLHLWNGTSI